MVEPSSSAHQGSRHISMQSNFLRVIKGDPKGFGLILISSILLGIWATSHTIALRNILLWVGALLAVFYWYNWYQTYKICSRGGLRSWVDWLPLMLIGIMFIWVIAHYFFFSQDAIKQFHELKSTWVRSFLATLIGSAVGLVIHNDKKKEEYNFFILSLGIYLSFLILFVQYLPKAVASNNLFAPDWFGGYIYWAKFNGVLVGCILISILVSQLIEDFLSNSRGLRSAQIRIAINTYGVIGIVLVFYSFTFIFDAKVGIGTVIILIISLGIFGLVFGLLNLFRKNKISLSSSQLTLIFTFTFLIAIIILLSNKHIKHNSGWESLLIDGSIAMQIDKYPNWQNPQVHGFPKRPDEVSVRANTYERVAMAVAGLKVIYHDPLGYGTFRSFPQQIKKYYPNYDSYVYTHSAWIDLGLAFGIPGLVLLPCALLIIGIRNLFSFNPHRPAILCLTLVILVLYSVGEYGFQQGVEILFFVCSFLAILGFSSPIRPSCIRKKPD